MKINSGRNEITWTEKSWKTSQSDKIAPKIILNPDGFIGKVFQM